MKYLFRTFILIFMISSCNKNPSIVPDSIKVKYPVEFPSSNTSYWKLYYKDPQGLISHVREEHDSVYLSNEVISLNIIDGNDTLIKEYKILKVDQRILYYDSVGWFVYPDRNYGLYRVDSIGNRILSVRTSDFSLGGPPYPTNRYFKEFELINYNSLSGDITEIPKINGYNTGTINTFRINMNGHILLKQTIANQDTIAKRIQFGCIKNTAKYAKAAMDNTIQLAPIWLYKYVYYYNPSDSIEIDYDTDLFY